MWRKFAISVLLLVVTVGVAAPVGSAPSPRNQTPNRFEDIFSPFETDAAALSPDGRLLAYSRRDGEQLAIVVVEVEQPSVAKCRVIVNTDSKATPYFANTQEKIISRILWLRWVNDRRVVFQTNWGMDGAVLSFDFDGKSERILATRHTSETFRSSARILDVSTEMNGAVLIETSGVRAQGSRAEAEKQYYRLDSVTGKFTRISKIELEHEQHALRESRDKRRSKRESALTELQKVFPGKAIDLLENSGDGDRWLALVEDTADPGGFYVFDRGQGRLWEFCRRLPLLDGDRVPGTTRVKFTAPDGEIIRGVLTMPKKPLSSPAPTVVVMPRLSDKAVSRQFRREIFVLSEMGVAVLQFDGFLTNGAGDGDEAQRERKQREQLLAVMTGASDFPGLSLRRVVLFGELTGALIALEALVDRPELFRGVVALDPLSSIPQFRDPKPWERASPKPGHMKRATQPGALLLMNSQRLIGARNPSEVKILAQNWRDAGNSVEVEPVTAGYFAGAPRACASVFRKIEPFLLDHLLDFDVRVGESKTVAP